MRVLISGAAGFVAHHLVAHILETADDEIVCLDRLDCSGNLNRLTDLDCWEREKRRVKIVWHDLKAPISDSIANAIGKIDRIFHLAAASHVDRSITDPMSFVLDNVVGTANMLDYARTRSPVPFLYFSTDEVFGPAPVGVKYKEWDRYKSGNPYAATKAGAEELAIAYHNTYGLPVIVTHTMNVFGERQHPEKFIPSTIRKVRDREMVIIHADKTLAQSGSRFYIHARAVASAVVFVMARGTPGEKYNIVGEREVSNLEMAREIAKLIGDGPHYEFRYKMVDFHSQRPGHDLRYALNGMKLAELGWTPPRTFSESLRQTVEWTLANPRWLN